MPGFTNPYGLIHEVPGDQPLISLTGGSSGTFPILAEQVNTELGRVDADIASALDDLADVETLAANVQVLDTIDTGSGTNTTEFASIDQSYRDLMILWRGRSDGSGEIDSLALRFNGDDGATNYTSRLSRNEAAGTYTSAQGAFSVLRAGHVGTHSTSPSAGTIWIPGYTSTIRKLAHGISNATGTSGGDNSAYTTQAGGYWTGTAAITTIRIWVSGQLWVGNPHITLLGIR
jgi:hypothetical protein